MKDDLKAAPPPRKDAPRIPPVKLILLGLFALAVLYFGGRWVYETFIKSDEDKIRDVMAACVEGARDSNPHNVSIHFTEDFKGPGRLTWDNLHQALVHTLMVAYKGGLEVILTPKEIPVTLASDKKSATSVFSVQLRGRASHESKDSEDITPLMGGSQFKLTFKKTDKGWQISQAELIH